MAMSNVPRSSDGTRFAQSFCTNSARTPSSRAIASASSTSKPIGVPGLLGIW